MKFKLNTIQQATLFLGLYSAGAIAFHPTREVLTHFGVIMGTHLLLFFIFKLLTKKKKILLDTFISAFILFLVLHYATTTQELLYPVIASALVMIGKFFLEVKGSPILNPVVGSLIGLFILARLVPGWEDPFVSWWGVNFGGMISLAAILVWAVIEVKHFKKYGIIVTFLALNILIAQWRGESIDFIKFAYTDATLYFFSCIMLIEPRTSPIKFKQQLAYGLLAVTAYNGLAYTGVPYFELFTIAAVNLLNFGFRMNVKPPTVIKI